MLEWHTSILLRVNDRYFSFSFRPLMPYMSVSRCNARVYYRVLAMTENFMNLSVVEKRYHARRRALCTTSG